MDILVTGATGFVGRAIVEELSASKFNNRKIYSFGRRESVKSVKLPNFSAVDITKPETFSSVENLSKIDVIIHSAGLAHQFQNPVGGKFLQVNVEGTKNILDFAGRKSVGHFILISSVAVYGNENENENIKRKIDEAEPCNPKSEYALSKLKAEETAVKFCRENNIALTILRLATVIGEDDRGNVARLIEAIDKKRFLMIGTGENYKTLIYKRDAAKACRIILEKKDVSNKASEIFNIAGEPVQMRYIVEKISESLTKKSPKFFIPLKLIYPPLNFFAKVFPSERLKSLKETLKKWTTNEIFSNEKIKQKYFFAPETSISEAIEREVICYKKQRC